MVSAVQSRSAGEAELSRKGTGTPSDAATSLSRSQLLAKRETIRNTYRDLEQPATVVELCEQYLKLESTDGVVWAWYGHSLSELGRYGESAAALQTARGLVTTEDTRAFAFQCQGDLEYGQGRYAKAAEFYREAVAEGVGDWALMMLGRVLFRLAATDETEQCLRQAVAMKGSHPATALYELGRILQSRSELFESRRVLRQALALEPHDDVRECLADVERAIRLQSPAGGRPKLLPAKNASS